MIYEDIRRNKWKSFFLIFLFIIFVIILGYFLGYIFAWGYFAIVIAVIIAITMTLVSYYSGDKVVLSLSKARPAKQSEFPFFVHTIEGLALAAGIPKPKAYVIDSDAMNAFACGRNPENASVCATTGLLKKLNRQELEGVIAHEMSHVKNYDIRIMMLAAVLVGVVVIIADIMFRSFIWGGARNNREGGHPAIMIVGIVLIILSPFIAQIIKLAISRKREYLADADGAMLTRYPKGLADALKKISADHNELKTASNATAHLYISNPFKKKHMFKNLFSTHPPVADRIAKLEKM